MKRQWTNEELIDHFTLSPQELDLIGDSKTDHNLLGFAVLLKYFQYEGRFPSQKHDVPSIVIVHLAQQLGVVPEKIIPYDWEGRSIKAHRAAIRAFLHVHEATLSDEEAIIEWLCQHVLTEQRQEDAIIASVYTYCKENRIDPPTPDRIRRFAHTALHRFDERLCVSIMERLSAETRASLDDLLAVVSQDVEELPATLSSEQDALEEKEAPSPPYARSALSFLKQDAGSVSLESILQETAKLERIHQLALPADLFSQISPKILQGYRQRIAVEELQEVRRHPDPIRLTLLSAFCWLRRQEIVDTLIKLLMDVIHHIGTKAERRVEKEFVNDIKKVSGKTTILFRLAEAVVDKPDGVVRDVVFSIVSEQTLRDLVKEYKSTGSAYQQKVQTMMRSSYSRHYRRMVPVILKHLEFCSNNEVHRPVILALEVLKKYVDLPSTQAYFPRSETVPLEVVPKDWRPAVVKSEKDQEKEHINRINYELCVLQALREKVRCKELWAKNANRFRNPGEDLPKDFETKRQIYYDALHQPQDVEIFIGKLQQEMKTALTMLNQTIPNNTGVQLLPKGGGWISLSPLEPQPEPTHLRLLKGELGQRWPMIELLDMLKETDLRVHFTDHFKSSTIRENLDRATIQKRLLLCLYGLGTNMGLKRASAGDHGESYRDLLYVRNRFLTKDQLRAAITEVANAIFRIRLPTIWGEGTTACASDSKKFSAWDQNLMTEWHARYRGPGVLIYWHVERKSTCIYSQLKNCSSSEVAAMITGLLRHCTEMQVDRNYVDTHGQSEIGFAFCSLLGFQLLPRLKNIHAQKLYRCDTSDTYPNLQNVLTRSINWEVIRQQYDEMVKFATALRLGTAETEEILRRFTRNGIQHPTYKGLAELGKVYKTIFLCNYLGSEALRREIQEGLNVVENWNSATNFILYGRHGEFSSNRQEDQELTMLSMHLLQVSLVYIQTLMIQDVLAEPEWMNKMTKEDLRGLTPLIYSNVNPYGLIRLNMAERLTIESAHIA
ncbi:MAG TPA: Tn3 family transposase [Ktedonobacteraceae bacterium]|nr:Tn3 family transposase [Ktedonobacteraceae bacterium]